MSRAPLAASSISLILLLTTPPFAGAHSSFGALRTRSVMVDGALVLPINVFGLSGTPAELPSVKRPGSRRAKVDEDGVASHGGVVADLNMICIDGGNLACSSNGAIGAGVDEPAPSKIGAGLPIPSGKDGL